MTSNLDWRQQEDSTLRYHFGTYQIAYNDMLLLHVDFQIVEDLTDSSNLSISAQSSADTLRSYREIIPDYKISTRDEAKQYCEKQLLLMLGTLHFKSMVEVPPTYI